MRFADAKVAKECSHEMPTRNVAQRRLKKALAKAKCWENGQTTWFGKSPLSWGSGTFLFGGFPNITSRWLDKEDGCCFNGPFCNVMVNLLGELRNTPPKRTNKGHSVTSIQPAYDNLSQGIHVCSTLIQDPCFSCFLCPENTKSKQSVSQFPAWEKVKCRCEVERHQHLRLLHPCAKSHVAGGVAGELQGEHMRTCGSFWSCHGGQSWGPLSKSTAWFHYFTQEHLCFAAENLRPLLW